MTWILYLNDMRSSKCEVLTKVCRADTREELVALLERESVEMYRDGGWVKTLRKGGPLEWFNAPYSFDDDRHFVEVDFAIDERVAMYRDQLKAEINSMLRGTPAVDELSCAKEPTP